MVEYAGRAPSFVRQSLVGTMGSSAVGKNMAMQPPPILILPPDLSLDRLVGSVMDAYGVKLETDFWKLENDEEGQRRFALELFNRGVMMATGGNYRGASDILSLSVLIYPNYYFNYSLSLVRFRLGDYSGALMLMERAMKQIREQQALEKELAEMARKADFSANFYRFYITVLLFNHKREQARAMVEFVLNKKIITKNQTLLELMRQYRVTDDKKTLAKIGKELLSRVHKIGDDEKRGRLLLQVRQVLV
jgi:tetratricopeptide (TPR) repeat protein